MTIPTIPDHIRVDEECGKAGCSVCKIGVNRAAVVRRYSPGEDAGRVRGAALGALQGQADRGYSYRPCEQGGVGRIHEGDTMSTPTIVEFITARLGEWEQAAREATPGPWSAVEDEPCSEPIRTVFNAGGMLNIHYEPTWESDALHIALHDPASTLALVAALRSVLGRAHVEVLGVGSGCETCEILYDLAAIWADHPDYDGSWGREPGDSQRCHDPRAALRPGRTRPRVPVEPTAPAAYAPAVPAQVSGVAAVTQVCTDCLAGRHGHDRYTGRNGTTAGADAGCPNSVGGDSSVACECPVILVRAPADACPTCGCPSNGMCRGLS